MLGLTIRLIFALAVVVGLVIVLSRMVQHRYKGKAGSTVQLLHRQPVGRNASVAILTIGTRVLVVGATEQNVTLLTELDPEELEMEVVARPDELEPLTDEEGNPIVPARFRPSGALGGSILSPETWKQAWKVVRPARKSHGNGVG